MRSVSATRKPRKVVRTIKLAVAPFDGVGVVTIRAGKVVADYQLTTIAADYGRGFQLDKLGGDADPETYHVNLSSDGNVCDCKGHCRWGHCKHADGLAALVKAGKL